jgi:acetyl esterase/lipase
VTTHNVGRWAIGRDPRPYSHIPQWGGQIADYYRVNMETGERHPIVEALVRQMGTSPDGRWFVYFKDETLHAHDLETGGSVNLSARAPVSFANENHSHPNETSNYGMAGWTEDGESIVLNHRYDLWRVPVEGEGEAENLTRGMGSEERIVFRLQGAGSSIDLSVPQRLSAFGERTKHSGFWRLRPGQDPEPIIYEDLRIGNPIRADSANRVIYTRETFTQFPDFWVADTTMQNPRKVTDANPGLSEFAWSPGRVLINYTNRRGHELQATLGLPAGYEPGRRYPMLVYFYETMSQQHHSFQLPRYDDRPHMATYASNGYLVLQPDIVYTMGEPGSSALDDLTSAVQAVIDAGYADPDRIGLQGHSWGGYQSSFVLTQTDIFAAVVTGAPVTNLVSFYNELYASSGNVQQGITEAGQVRMGMGVTPWTHGELYRSQSPVHQVQNINTPFLILHGTEDGAVDWRQGLEFFNSARRNGKEVILLSYPGEAHHLNRRANQVDFQVRMRQFFDHYLLDEPAPGWMVEGVPFIDKFRATPLDPPSRGTVTDSDAQGGGH